MYLEIDEGYFEHPKTLRLCAALRDHHAAIYPVRLWKWACRSARDGRLGTVDAFVIEKVVGYEPMDGACFQALRDVGFIDQDTDGLKIHDWMERTGGAIKRMEDKASENRRRREEGKKRHDSEKAQRDAGTVPESYQNRTGTNPSQTRPDQTSQDLSLRAPARDPSGTAEHGGTTVPHNEPGKPSARNVLAAFARIRGETCGGKALFFQPTEATVEKAARWLEEMPVDAVVDVEPAIRRACLGVRDGAKGWSDGRMSDPMFLFASIVSRWSSLREDIHGCAPKVAAAKDPREDRRPRETMTSELVVR